MFDPIAMSEGLRRKALQPVADWLVTHAGPNCFKLAAGILVASQALGAATSVNQALTGHWDNVEPIAAVPVAFTVLAVAVHLVRFQARADRTHFRVVHPLFRRYEWAFLSPLALLPVAVAVRTLAMVASRGPSWDLVWDAADTASIWLLFAGCVFAGCEWRRLPPVTRREAKTTGGMAPQGI